MAIKINCIPSGTFPHFLEHEKEETPFGLSGGRQMGASGRMNMSEKMLEL